jgi:hypothetical protein
MYRLTSTYVFHHHPCIPGLEYPHLLRVRVYVKGLRVVYRIQPLQNTAPNKN